ncbi:MAG: hypothetical protein ACU836_07515 [Gammaproteobacteria bacterium]
MSHDQTPPSLEKLSKDLELVMEQVVLARDQGIATNIILIELLVQLSANRLIDGRKLCETLAERLPRMAPDGAKIDLALQINELIAKLQSAPLNS